MAAFGDGVDAAMPFAVAPDDDKIGDTFTKEDDGDGGDEAGVGFVVATDENKVANDGDKNVKEGVEDSFDANFAGFFPGGENDEEWSCHDDGEAY